MSAARGLIGALLPPPVRWADAVDDDGPDELFEAERAAVARAVDKRRREFATVRRCARAALAELDVPRAPLLPGERGAPQWPRGVVGSMTHCDGYRAAAAARATDVLTIGIDAEPAEALPDGVLDTIALPEERAAVAALPGPAPWDRLLFSAKESVYKAWFPLAGTFLDFHEARIALDPDGTFTARFLIDGPVVDGARLAGVHGRWTVRDGLLATAVALPRRG